MAGGEEVPGAEAQLYEEIKDPETDNIVHTAFPATTPQYEYVMPVSKSSNPYQLTQCSAYGVALNN